MGTRRRGGHAPVPVHLLRIDIRDVDQASKLRQNFGTRLLSDGEEWEVHKDTHHLRRKQCQRGNQSPDRLSSKPYWTRTSDVRLLSRMSNNREESIPTGKRTGQELLNGVPKWTYGVH